MCNYESRVKLSKQQISRHSFITHYAKILLAFYDASNVFVKVSQAGSRVGPFNFLFDYSLKKTENALGAKSWRKHKTADLNDRITIFALYQFINCSLERLRRFMALSKVCLEY